MTHLRLLPSGTGHRPHRCGSTPRARRRAHPPHALENAVRNGIPPSITGTFALRVANLHGTPGPWLTCGYSLQVRDIGRIDFIHLCPTEMVAPAGLEPARDRPHKEAPSRLHTPSLTERNGTIQPPATGVPHHRLHRGAKSRAKSPLHLCSTDRPNAYISRPASRRLPFGVRISCARLLPLTGSSTLHGYLTVRMSVLFAITGRCVRCAPRSARRRSR